MLPQSSEQPSRRSSNALPFSIALARVPALVVDVDLLGIGIVDVHPGDVEAPPELLPLAHVQLRAVAHGQHLESAAARQR